MKQQLIAALGSKVIVGIGATALAFGTAGTVLALQPASSDHTPAPLVAADETTTTTSTTVAPTTTSTTSTTVAPTTTTTAHDADDDHGNDGTEVEREHPDNFGAQVSEDAHDGGVDGQEISTAAHERNDERAAEREAGDDHGGDSGHGGSGRDHGEDD